MQGDTLRQPLLAGSSAWSSGRFTPLLLEHNEYYFQRHDAVAILPLHLAVSTSPHATATPVCKDATGDQGENASDACASPVEGSGGGAAVTRRQQCTGVLHVCSRSIFFEPTDVTWPVIRVPLSQVERFTRWEPDADECSMLRECNVAIDSIRHASAASLHTRPHSPSSPSTSSAPSAPNVSPKSCASSPSHSSPKSASGKTSWLSAWKTQLLGASRGSAKASGCKGGGHSNTQDARNSSAAFWDLCRIDALHVATQLARQEFKRAETQARPTLMPLLEHVSHVSSTLNMYTAPLTLSGAADAAAAAALRHQAAGRLLPRPLNPFT